MEENTISLIVYLLLTIFIFLLKALFFVTFGIFLGLLFKKNSFLQIFAAFIVSLMWVLRESFGFFTSIFNPFSENYDLWIWGSKFVNINTLKGYIYDYIEPDFKVIYVLYYLFISLLFIIISFPMLKFENKINFTSNVLDNFV